MGGYLLHQYAYWTIKGKNVSFDYDLQAHAHTVRVHHRKTNL